MADSPSIFARLRKSREELAEAERSRRASEEAVAAAAAKAAEEEEAAMQAALGEQLETGDASLRASRPAADAGKISGGDDADAVGGDEGIPAPHPRLRRPRLRRPRLRRRRLRPLLSSSSGCPYRGGCGGSGGGAERRGAAMVQASHEEGRRAPSRADPRRLRKASEKSAHKLGQGP